MGVPPTAKPAISIRYGAGSHFGALASESDGISAPGWVQSLFEPARVPARKILVGRMELLTQTNHAGTLSLTTCRLAEADRLDVDELRDAVSSMYLTASGAIATGGMPHPVRVWQFIPDIHKVVGPGMDRYMAFNQGRFAACCAWFGGASSFAAALPAATAVGHTGRDLFIHFLTAGTPGRPVENPRQRPAFEYSRKFGPRPPCFARGTVVSEGGADRLLIAGTASIRGEESVFAGDLNAQVEETLENLSALIRVAARSERLDRRGALGLIDTARVYVVDSASAPAAASRLRAALPGVRDLEVILATVCRTDLLLEVEATASLSAGSAGEEVMQ